MGTITEEPDKELDDTEPAKFHPPLDPLCGSCGGSGRDFVDEDAPCPRCHGSGIEP